MHTFYPELLSQNSDSIRNNIKDVEDKKSKKKKCYNNIMMIINEVQFGLRDSGNDRK